MESKGEKFNIELVKQRLDKVKMSQSDLAREIKVTRQAVNGWFAGDSTPSLRNLEAIAEALNCSVFDFFMRG